jgi:hypothetical protein
MVHGCTPPGWSLPPSVPAVQTPGTGTVCYAGEQYISQIMKDRDRHLKLVEWSEENGCYVGSVPGWIGTCRHGDSEAQVYILLHSNSEY